MPQPPCWTFTAGNATDSTEKVRERLLKVVVPTRSETPLASAWHREHKALDGRRILPSSIVQRPTCLPLVLNLRSMSRVVLMRAVSACPPCRSQHETTGMQAHSLQIYSFCLSPRSRSDPALLVHSHHDVVAGTVLATECCALFCTHIHTHVHVQA